MRNRPPSHILLFTAKSIVHVNKPLEYILCCPARAIRRRMVNLLSPLHFSVPFLSTHSESNIPRQFPLLLKEFPNVSKNTNEMLPCPRSPLLTLYSRAIEEVPCHQPYTYKYPPVTEPTGTPRIRLLSNPHYFIPLQQLVQH